MTIRIETLSRSDQEYLTTQLPDEPTEDQVQEVAAGLVKRMSAEPDVLAQALMIVRRQVGQRRGQQAVQEAVEAGQHYVFAKLTRTATSNHPVYEQLKVFKRDLSAFCKAQGLYIETSSR